MYILFDIGGTKMRIAGSKDGKTFGDPVELATPQSFEEGMRLVAEHARSLAGGAPIRAVAGGVKGPVTEGGILAHPPMLPNWQGRNLKHWLEEELKTSVFVENDTAVVGLGEAVVGAGKDTGIVVYVTISTGANGVRVIDRKLDRSRFGFEIGHHIIDTSKKMQCTCAPEPTLGHPEAYITGAAFERRFGKKAYEITDENIWGEAAKILGVLLHNVIAFWSPDSIVVGGSMIVGTVGPVISLDATRKHMEDLRTISPQIPAVVPAELGSFGGIHGALALLALNIEE